MLASPLLANPPNSNAAGKVIIFLDIDGVLLPFPQSNPSTCGSIFPDSNLEAFSRILAAVPEALVVLSSTWRAQDSMVRDILESFRCYSYAFGDDNNIGKITEFYDVTDPEFHSERQYEIFRWLHQAQNEKDVRAWIALDDEELVEGKVNAKHRATFEGHAVLIDSRKGLTDEDADEAIRLLQSQIKTKSRETNK